MKTKKFTKLIAIFTALITCALVFASCSSPENPSEEKYQQALEMIGKGNYESAYSLFKELGDYKDSKKQVSKFRFAPTKHFTKYVDLGVIDTYDITLTLNENNLPSKNTMIKNDETINHSVFTYNENGKLIKINSDDTSAEEYSYVIIYNDKGKVINKTNYFTDGGSYTEEYTYNDKGYETKTVMTFDGEFFRSSEYTLDESGKIITETIVDSEGSFTLNYTYDNNGNLINKSEIIEGGVILTNEEYIYNEKGLLIKTIYKENGEVYDVCEFTYDEKGQLIKEHFESIEGMFYTNEYTYDNNGNVIKETHVDFNDYEYCFESEYKLVYVAFEYSDSEWKDLVDLTRFW